MKSIIEAETTTITPSKLRRISTPNLDLTQFKSMYKAFFIYSFLQILRAF